VLEELQVDWIQGYHVGRPVPLSSLAQVPEQVVPPA
jgi:EAL domain-containing protein (putative c-di-GMP-specific phosphodiesterase class I)